LSNQSINQSINQSCVAFPLVGYVLTVPEYTNTEEKDIRGRD